LRATASCRAAAAGSGLRPACHRVFTQTCHAGPSAVGVRGSGIRSLGAATQTEVSLLFSPIRLLASGHSESHRSDAAEFAGGPTRRSLQGLACRDIACRHGGSELSQPSCAPCIAHLLPRPGCATATAAGGSRPTLADGTDRCQQRATAHISSRGQSGCYRHAAGADSDRR
jgi:hypothetical protein